MAGEASRLGPHPVPGGGALMQRYHSGTVMGAGLQGAAPDTGLNEWFRSVLRHMLIDCLFFCPVLLVSVKSCFR